MITGRNPAGCSRNFETSNQPSSGSMKREPSSSFASGAAGVAVCACVTRAALGLSWTNGRRRIAIACKRRVLVLLGAREAVERLLRAHEERVAADRRRRVDRLAELALPE